MSIRVENVSKRFGNFVALDDVSLEFPSGELVALLGPSGCGKTSLLRIIAGLEQADRGRVVLDGADASRTKVNERRVGFVFQHYALFRHMSVFENVAFGLRVRPRKERPVESEIRRRVMELLQLVQLDWLGDRYPAQLSGGQRQRIALARALAVEPRVLLLDEPFGALDAKVRKELRRWLRRLHDELRITSVFVTHDRDEAMEVADRVVLMNHGRVEQAGSPADVYERPATAFAYEFLGESNRFHGNVDGAEVIAFARPHEMSIVRDNGRGGTGPGGVGTGGVAARVIRVVPVGASARVELVDAMSEQIYEVLLTRAELATLRLDAGALVRVVPSQVRIFDRDEALEPGFPPGARLEALELEALRFEQQRRSNQGAW